MASPPLSAPSRLPAHLQGLDIIEIQSLKDARHNLDLPKGKNLIRHGASAMVYRIENPAGRDSYLGPYLACKKIILNSDEDIEAVRSEMSIVRHRMTSVRDPTRLRIEATYYRPSDNSKTQGTVYIILEAWIDLSLQTLIDHAIGKPGAEFAPCYQQIIRDDWPKILYWLFEFLASLTRDSVFRPLIRRTLPRKLDGKSGTQPRSPIGEVETTGFWEINETEGRMTQFNSKLELVKIVDNPNIQSVDRIWHRDLKPANFLFKFAPRSEYKYERHDTLHPVGIDFGISKYHRDPSNPSAHYTGTPAYLAPEVLEGGANFRSDIWSLGCCVIFIEAFIHSGMPGVKKVFDIAVRGNDSSFRDGIDEVNEFLDQDPSPGLAQDVSPHMEEARKRLRKMVKEKMMVPESQRGSAHELLEKVMEIRAVAKKEFFDE
ncbi:hypothetical protein MRS44_016657 [Fusarium solani]|uniref:uncharacterized protein n=1 Tax=Fusarium solani TaxID=169388 RepID=UPI0032C4B190|nr:hypothetical protein MRS44_016657 [Fusarium solani]